MTLLVKILIAVVIVFLCVFFSPTTLKAAITGAPFLPTPKKVIRKALKIAKLRPGERLYDLGCGSGRVLIIGAKEFGARVVGIEYSIPFFIISEMNLWLRRIKNGKIHRQDFLKADIAKADVIFMYLTPKAFPKLKDKFDKELELGTRIVTFSSPLLFWQPETVIDLPKTKSKLYLYIKK